MKKLIYLFKLKMAFICFFIFMNNYALQAQCPHPDYGALSAIYNANPGNTLGWDLNDCDVCTWDGVTCDGSGNISELSLRSKNLTMLPSEIGDIVSLLDLDLFGNQLTGLPAEIGDLVNLTRLVLLNNQLNAVPPEIGNLASLEILFLSNNQLTAIPRELSNLSELWFFHAAGNQLSVLPVEIWSMINLEALGLGNNQFETIPPEIGNLTNLTSLSLGTNLLTALPVELGNLVNLEGLSFSNNQLTAIPVEIGNLVNLTGLSFSGNQITSLPVEIGNLTNLTTLFFSNNLIECFPEELSNLCSNNGLIVLSGGNPLPFTWAQFCADGSGTCGCAHPDYAALEALYNATDGANWNTPWDLNDCDVCNWNGVNCTTNDRVSSLSMPNNNMTGPLPPAMGDLTELTAVNFNNNNLTAVPAELWNLTSLQFLVMPSNDFNGTIPASVGNLTNLQTLSLGDNNFTGGIPVEIGGLSSLTFLSLFSNQLTGAIPAEIWDLTNLTFLNFNNNDLSGTISPSIGNLNSLSNLGLANNQFDGPVPPGLGSLTSLSYVQMQGNQFSGDIPVELSNLTNISIGLFLYNNNLTPCIPPELIALCGKNIRLLEVDGSAFIAFCADDGTNSCDPCAHPNYPGNADADGDGVSVCDGDCDDSNANNFPGNSELCDGMDNNCNGEIDEPANASSQYEWIESVALTDLANSSGDNGGYADFTFLTATLATGESYPMVLTPGFSGSAYWEYWRVYIDFNQDGVFSHPSERVIQKAGYGQKTGTVHVPSTALTGPAKMRVIMSFDGFQLPCSQNFEGETEDYSVFINACDNVSNGGQIGEDETLCPANNDPAAISNLALPTGGSGVLEYLWMENTSHGLPPTQNMSGWTVISGATGDSYDPAPISQTTWYIRCARRNGCTVYLGESNVVKKAFQNNCNSYCSSEGQSTAYEWIKRVKMGAINNNSGDDGGYGDYTHLSTDVYKNDDYNIKLKPGFSNGAYHEYWRVWIDWDQDGTFDLIDELAASGHGYGTINRTVTVPSWAASGPTQMRVAMKYDSYPDPCELFAEGEVEDYSVNVLSTFNLAGNSSDDTHLQSIEPSSVVEPEGSWLELSPNPANDVVTIRFDGLVEAGEIKITDQMGRTVKSIQPNKGTSLVTLDLSNGAFNNGLYFVNLISNGERLTKRLVVVK
ncbi:MAG: GEVED domain-containing protein [Bacteroidota bacterium]